MQIDLEKFENSKSRDLIPLVCKNCNVTFYRKKHHIQAILHSSSKRSSTMDYCSSQCSPSNQRDRIKVKCKTCGTPFERVRSWIKKSKFSFCSKSCSVRYWNLHKNWGGRRSKLEKWIENELTIQFPSLKIIYNGTKIIGAELDIYIPSLKLAFELNGIFHYEPIFGAKKLTRIKENDACKFQLCLKKGIELCIISTYPCKYLKKERDKKYLSIIIDIISKKLERGVGLEPT